MSTIHIQANFHSFWHIGTGRGSGYHLDAIVEKDADDLPYVPGKTLKGLMRDAFFKLCEWQHFESSHLDLLFGKRVEGEGESRQETSKGVLRFSSLELEEKDYLLQNKPLIDDKTGVAKDKSFRMIEFTIPVKLHGEIEILNVDALDLSESELQLLLQQAASLITHIGANKTRGFGAVTLEVK
jgi:CRISPR/Cas system CSM-associated protein Csm3 (group 7 of RAMP superfamily)